MKNSGLLMKYEFMYDQLDKLNFCQQWHPMNKRKLEKDVFQFIFF